MNILPAAAGQPTSKDALDPSTVGNERALLLTVLAASVVAWVLLVLTHSSALDHHSLGGLLGHRPATAAPHEHGHGDASSGASAGSVGLQAGVVLLGWTVMVVAMMLPPALPMLQLLRQLVGRRRHPHWLIWLGALTFTIVWLVVGTLMIAGDTVLHAALSTQEWAVRTPYLVTGTVLLGAGLYQFTPLKTVCLRACRTPRSFALAHWRGQRPAAMEVAALSGAYAVSCVGCCWALMTVSFAVGAAALPVMVVLALLMATERLVRWGRHLVRPAGLLLLALGVVTALGLLPLGALAE